MGVLGDLFRSKAFSDGQRILAVAEAFERDGHHGPACYLYEVAADKLRFGGAVPRDVQKVFDRADVCWQTAELKGEHPGYARQASADEIVKHPSHFLNWYYAQQEGPETPWQPPTYQEAVEAQGQAIHAQMRADTARQEQEEARKKRHLETVGKPLFKKRFAAMLDSAAMAADGNEEAFKTALSLYKHPSDKEEWGQHWAEYARRALQETLAHDPQHPKITKALRVMPRIAYEGERMSFKRNAAYLGVFCLVYPICELLIALFMWVAPDGDPESFIGSLFWAGIALIMLVPGIAAWILKWCGIPIVIVWGIVLVARVLPRSRRGKRAVEAGDLTLLEIEKLFRSKNGAAILPADDS